MSSPRPSTSLEIVAVFKGTVLDVRHLQPLRPRTAGRALGVVGGVLLTAGLGWFLSQTVGQHAEWTEYQGVAARAAMAGAPLPSAPASRWIGAALAAAFGGIVALALAIIRASDRQVSSYTIGEGADAVLATPPADLMTPDAFELARLGPGGAAGLRFTAEMTGTITVRGRRYTLREWTAQGWAVAEHGALGTTLPPGARCRLEHGQLVFHIAVVEAAVVSVGRAELDVPFWVISAASFAGLGSLLGLALLSTPTAGALELDDMSRASRFVGYLRQPAAVPTPISPAYEPSSEPVPERSAPRRRVESPELLDPVNATAEPAGAARPEVSKARVASRGSLSARREEADPKMFGRSSVAAAAGMMARGAGPGDLAREAGLLAFVDTSVFQNEHADAFSLGSDNDAADRAMWQAMKDSDPMAKPVGGLGLIGKGRGGGPDSTDDMVRSTPQSGSVEGRTRLLIVRVGRATVRGPRSRAEVQAFVAKHTRALRRCHDPGADDGETPSGRVTLELEIEAGGDVRRASVARSRGVDTRLTDCMARAARAWSFPTAKGKRRTVVSLPLTLRGG